MVCKICATKTVTQAWCLPCYTEGKRTGQIRKYPNTFYPEYEGKLKKGQTIAPPYKKDVVKLHKIMVDALEQVTGVKGVEYV